jgi:hypothetical protein
LFDESAYVVASAFFIGSTWRYFVFEILERRLAEVLAVFAECFREQLGQSLYLKINLVL